MLQKQRYTIEKAKKEKDTNRYSQEDNKKISYINVQILIWVFMLAQFFFFHAHKLFMFVQIHDATYYTPKNVYL